METQSVYQCPKLIAKLSYSFPDLLLFYDYADEDTGSNVGQLQFKAGECTFENIPETQSKEAFRICFELNGDEEYYRETETGYESIEE